MRLRKASPYLLFFSVAMVWVAVYRNIPIGGLLLKKDLTLAHPDWKKTDRLIRKDFDLKMDGRGVPLTLLVHTAVDSAGKTHIADFTLIRKSSPRKIALSNLTYEVTCCQSSYASGYTDKIEELHISGNFDPGNSFFSNNIISGKLVELTSNGVLEPRVEVSGEGVYELMPNGKYVLIKKESYTVNKAGQQ